MRSRPPARLRRSPKPAPRTLLPAALGLVLGACGAGESPDPADSGGTAPGGATAGATPAGESPATDTYVEPPRPEVAVSDAVTQGPNVILLLGSNHRADSLGVLGHPSVQTPHLDRLAAEGVHFQRVLASSPLAVPTRATLLTGRPPELHRATNNSCSLPPEEVTWPELLRDAGYATTAVGRLRRIYDGFEPVHVPGRMKVAHHYEPVDEERPGAALGTLDLEAHEGWDHRIATAALDQLDVLATGDRPFALCVGFFAASPPYAPPRPYDTLIDPADVRVPPVDSERRPTYWQRKARVMAAQYLPGERPQVLARYFGLVSYLDAQVGRLLDRLDELGLAENTVVAYVPDQSSLLFEHGLVGGGASFYEEEMTLPALVRFPASLPAGVGIDSLVTAADLATTLLALTGQTPPPSFLGTDLGPLARGEADAPKGPWFATLDLTHSGVKVARGYMVRTDRWKLTWATGDEGELYDLASDPDERVNLYGDPEHRAVRDELWSRIVGRAVLRWGRAGAPGQAASPGITDGVTLTLLEDGRARAVEGELVLEVDTDGNRTLGEGETPVADATARLEDVLRLEQTLLKHVSLSAASAHLAEDDSRTLARD